MSVLSSAYCDIKCLTLLMVTPVMLVSLTMVLVSASVITRNSSGLNGQPCATPELRGNDCPKWPLMAICLVGGLSCEFDVAYDVFIKSYGL